MKRWLAGRVDWRVRVTLALGVTAASLMVQLGMEPRLVLVTFVVAVTGTSTWLALDLGPVATPLEWTEHGRDAEPSSRSDHRVRALRRRLRTPTRRRRSPSALDTHDPEPIDEIAGTLVGIIDDHLAAEFGIERAHDPADASGILGPELAAFVGDPSRRRSMTGRRSLARTVALIEDLCSRTHAARRTPT